MQALRAAMQLAVSLSLSGVATAHTLNMLRVTPGKLAAGDTATIAARFEFDAPSTACAVSVDFGDGTPAQTVVVTAEGQRDGAGLWLEHVYAQGAYMVSVVPIAAKPVPACTGGKHSMLIDVSEPSSPPPKSLRDPPRPPGPSFPTETHP